MTCAYSILLAFFLTNCLWFNYLIDDFYKGEVSPAFIANSLDLHTTDDTESIFLKSMRRQFEKYYPQNSHLKNENDGSISFLKSQDNYFTNEAKIQNSPTSKFSIFLNRDNSMINVLQISNDRETHDKFDPKQGEITLYSIPIYNFVLNNKNDYSVNKSLFQRCWSSKLNGRILGVVASNEKDSLAVFYRIVKGSSLTFRMRFFHNLECSSKEAIQRSDLRMDNEYVKYIDGRNNLNEGEVEVEDEDEGEILEGNSNSNNARMNVNIFNEESYDDFAFQGRSPIVAMAVRKNVIAYTRNANHRQINILKREAKSWKLSFNTQKLSHDTELFIHTNSLKFGKESSSGYNLLHTYLAINHQGIFIAVDELTTDILSNENHFKDMIRNLIYSQLDKDEKDIEINLEKKAENAKAYMKPTLFSNSNSMKTIMEFRKGHILLFDDKSLWSLSKSEEKIEKMSSDYEAENIVYKNENKEMFLIFSERNSTGTGDVEYKTPKKISLRKLPQKYRDKDSLCIFIEAINSKIIMFMLNEDGILLSVDLSGGILQSRDILTKIFGIFLKDAFYTIKILLLANGFAGLLYWKLCEMEPIGLADASIGHRYANEINHIIQGLAGTNPNGATELVS